MRQIEELYHSAREREPNERAAFLGQACRGDEDLRQEVERFIQQRAVKDYLSKVDPELGARPLRRAIQQYVEDVLSEKILFKEFHAGQTIVVDAAEGDDGTFLTFEGVEGLPPSVDFEDQTNA